MKLVFYNDFGVLYFKTAVNKWLLYTESAMDENGNQEDIYVLVNEPTFDETQEELMNMLHIPTALQEDPEYFTQN